MAQSRVQRTVLVHFNIKWFKVVLSIRLWFTFVSSVQESCLVYDSVVVFVSMTTFKEQRTPKSQRNTQKPISDDKKNFTENVEQRQSQCIKLLLIIDGSALSFYITNVNSEVSISSSCSTSFFFAEKKIRHLRQFQMKKFRVRTFSINYLDMLR